MTSRRHRFLIDFQKIFSDLTFVFLLLAGQSSNEFGSAPASFVGSARSASPSLSFLSCLSMFLNHSDEFGVKVLSLRSFFLRTLRTNRTLFWMRCAHPTQPQYKYHFHSVHFAVSFLFPTKIMKKKDWRFLLSQKRHLPSLFFFTYSITIMENNLLFTHSK